VIAPNTDVVGPQLESAHFDAVVLDRPLDRILPEGGIALPSGSGYLTLRSEKIDDLIVRVRWAPPECQVIQLLPIFGRDIAGIPWPVGVVCVDWLDGECDPNAGGADCIGMCVPAS